ncbi:hypothetical protein [Clavibacter zhangzhiyongii]|uniref:hypothetical protein n=1 Tax=Clavibacter zhangzhiyongii TaxID=2768071 RepID=UPI0039DFF299
MQVTIASVPAAVTLPSPTTWRATATGVPDGQSPVRVVTAGGQEATATASVLRAPGVNSFSVVTTGLVSGTGFPGATVDARSGSAACRATVGASSTWACLLAPPPPSGTAVPVTATQSTPWSTGAPRGRPRHRQLRHHGAGRRRHHRPRGGRDRRRDGHHDLGHLRRGRHHGARLPVRLRRRGVPGAGRGRPVVVHDRDAAAGAARDHRRPSRICSATSARSPAEVRVTIQPPATAPTPGATSPIPTPRRPGPRARPRARSPLPRPHPDPDRAAAARPAPRTGPGRGARLRIRAAPRPRPAPGTRPRASARPSSRCPPRSPTAAVSSCRCSSRSAPSSSSRCRRSSSAARSSRASADATAPPTT